MRRAGAATGLVLLVSLAASARATVLDYLDTSNSYLAQTTELDGIGQTFKATDVWLTDASLMLAKDSSFHTAWVSGFRFEVRAGLPGNLDGTSGNVLFQSVPINIDGVPTVGTRFDQELKRLDLSDFGLTTPLALTVDQTYTLLVRDTGGSGTIGYAAVQPGTYAGGGATGNNRQYANDFWGGPTDIDDLVFRVEMVPEPSSACAIAAAGVVGMLGGRRRPRFRVIEPDPLVFPSGAPVTSRFDFDRDGRVGAADYSLGRANYLRRLLPVSTPIVQAAIPIRRSSRPAEDVVYGLALPPRD